MIMERPNLRKFPILLLLTTCMLSSIFVPVPAQERTVGVDVGYWIQYGVSVSWESNDPNATTPQYILDAKQTEFYSLVVQSISGTNITFDRIVHFKNGTEKSDTYWIDVDTGKGTGYLYFISVNLNAGDMIYTWPPGQGKINETITRTYLGEPVEVNHCNGTTATGMYYDIYWNRATGVLYEYYMNHPNYPGNAIVTESIFPIGVVPEFPTWTAWIAVIGVTTLVVFFSSRKLRYKT